MENITEHCPISGVALPANTNGTNENADLFILMSSLAASISISYPSVVDISSTNTETLHASFQRLVFAATIHPSNFIEGTSCQSLSLPFDVC